MSANIAAPPTTNSENFLGYDGVAMDICDKMTSLMALHEKIRLILDTYIDPATMKYKMEAIYPGLLPTGTVMAYYPIAKDVAAMRREVWQLQRTPDDLEGVNVLSDEALQAKAIWTVADGTYVAGIQSRDLRGRFIVGYLNDDTITNRTKKEIDAVGGVETVTLTPAQGGFVNHTHLLGHYGRNPESPAALAGDLTVHKIDPPITANQADEWRIENATNVAEEQTKMIDYNARTSGVYQPAGVPGPIYDSAPGRTETIVQEAHDNLPPFYTLVYIQRTARSDNTYKSVA